MYVPPGVLGRPVRTISCCNQDSPPHLPLRRFNGEKLQALISSSTELFVFDNAEERAGMVRIVVSQWKEKRLSSHHHSQAEKWRCLKVLVRMAEKMTDSGKARKFFGKVLPKPQATYPHSTVMKFE